MERTIPQFNFDNQYLQMLRMISYAQCQDHHCVTSLLDITVRHIYLKQGNAVLMIYYTWWMMIFSNTTDPHPDSHHSHSDIFNTFSIHCPTVMSHVAIPDPHPSPSLWHNLPYVFHSTTLETVLLSSHSPPHPTGCISTTVFIIFLLLILLLKACNVHILLLDIYLLYTL